MTNPFLDQARFMTMCEQTVGTENIDQYALYLNLIKEEVQELEDSRTRTDDLDALIDILVVTIGAIHSAGFNGADAWEEVMRTNFAKVDPVTGKIRKRGDGKILKPDGWTPPNLEPFAQIAQIPE
jgi:predicted HAD superfamily Cof-like phosphohydrolase